MAKVVAEYVVKCDDRKRITLRKPTFEYDHAAEREEDERPGQPQERAGGDLARAAPPPIPGPYPINSINSMGEGRTPSPRVNPSFRACDEPESGTPLQPVPCNL